MPLSRRTLLFQSASAVSLAGLGLGGCASSGGSGPKLAAQAPLTPTSTPQSGAPMGQATGHAPPAAKIALLLPLQGMGPTAEVARGIKRGAELALFDADNPNIQLFTKDDGGTPAGALAAARAGAADGANVVIGPLFSASAKDLKGFVAENQIPVLSFSNDPSAAGNGVYVMGLIPGDEVRRVVRYASQRGMQRFAALIPKTPYGAAVEGPFRQTVAEANGQIVAIETYDQSAGGMISAAKAVFAAMTRGAQGGSPVDALFVPVAPDDIRQMAPLLAYAGIDGKSTRLLGTAAWDISPIHRDTNMIGGWFASSEPSQYQAFTSKYQQAFGAEPPRLATLGFDAVRVAMSLPTGGFPQPFAAPSIERINGFAGVDGVVRFLPDGRCERQLAVVEIDQYRNVVLDPAAAQWPATPTSTASLGRAPA